MRYTTLNLLVAVLAIMGITTSLALANDSTPQKAAQLPPTVMVSLTKTSVSASDLASGKVTVLADMNLKAGVNVHSSRCFWTKKGQKWSNGGYGVNGTQFEVETTPAKLCPSAHSPTGWVKVAGGSTGRPCFNEAKVGKPPGPVVHGQVIWVHSLAQVNLTINASVSVTATGYDNVTHQVCGTATGSASSSARVRLRTFVKVKGAKNAAVKLYGKVYASAKAKATASVECGSVVVTIMPPPPPPQKPTPPVPPTPKPTLTMMWDTINDIPGGTCRPENLHVTSSAAGQVQISPTNGLVSAIDCYQPITGQLSLVTLPVSTGSHDLTVYVYAPADSSATSDTLSAVPQISGLDANANTVTTSFTISHPTRP
jgi:hypothetical protein